MYTPADRNRERITTLLLGVSLTTFVGLMIDLAARPPADQGLHLLLIFLSAVCGYVLMYRLLHDEH